MTDDNNYIENSMGIGNDYKRIILGLCQKLSSGDYDLSHLNSEQSHSGFNYHNDDGTKLIPASDHSRE